MEMNHLTDKQLSEWPIREGASSEHLSRCDRCRDDWDRFHNLVNGLAASAQSAAEQPEISWDRQRLSVRRQIVEVSARNMKAARMVWAAVFALVLIASFLLRTGSRVPVKPSAPDSDRELLVQVEQALDGEVPEALQPASLTVDEIDQAEPSPSNAIGTKEKSQHEN